MMSDVVAAHQGVLANAGAATPWYLAGGISAGNCVAAYQPKGAASYAASLSNLANPGTYDATEGTAPSWASGTGWTFDRSNSEYLETGVVPAADQSWSMFVRFTNADTSNRQAVIGSYTSSASFSLRSNNVGNHNYLHGSQLTVSTSLTNNIMGFAGRAAYLDGVSDGTIDAGTGPFISVWIGAEHGSSNYSNATVIAACIYNTTITSDQATALSTAMAAL